MNIFGHLLIPIFMKRAISALLFFCFIYTIQAQKVKSSCSAHDSIVAKYRNDADRLALRMIYKIGSAYIDSATIQKTLSDTMLNALIAVYNADSLPARDTVIFMRNLHTYPTPVMTNFYMAADSMLPWMQQLRLDSSKIGTDSVGFLIKTYKLKVVRYYRINQFPYHIAIFESSENLNLDVLTRLFNKIGGVYFANKGKVEGDGNDITQIKTKNFIELIYSYGWENCQTGCLNRRFWKFNVYPNCSVDFLGSYGSIWKPSSIIGISENHVQASPNPFHDKITLQNLNGPCQYRLINTFGQVLKDGNISAPQIENLEGLTAGIYYLQILSNHSTKTYRVVKE